MQMPPEYRPQPHHIMAPPPMQHNGPADFSGSVMHDGKYFTLRVEQQPDRARMCGFGDKDRRPITPPPCIRLVITDATTGQEVDYQEVQGYYILGVDIWDETGTQPANEVKHSSSSASVSISMATVTSYPPQPDQTPQHHFVQHVPGMPPAGPYGHPQYLPPLQGGAPQQPGQGPPPGYPPSQQPPHQQQQRGGPPQWPQSYMAPQAQPPPPGAPPGAPNSNGQFQRNLIGSSHVSAVQLLDLDNNFGYWFVLQDLSVRTEGVFRLKLTFMDIRQPNGSLNSEKVNILASTFTDPFQVFSAKKFPGVKESTELSRCFATQGVKIPIRKDTGGTGGAGSRGGRRDDDDDD